MAYRVALVGGGSGGHVFPLVAIAKKLKEIGQQNGINVKIQFIGSGNFLKDAAKEAGVPFKHVISGKIRSYSSSKNFTDVLKMPFGLVQALWHFLFFMPNVVLVKGGHGSLLPGLAARFYMIPIYVHESDSVPGKANRILSGSAKKIFTAFEAAAVSFPGKSVQLVGNPIREEILNGNREEGIQYFKLDTLGKTVLFLGGSQGAQAINKEVLESLIPLTESFQIIHQTGQGNFNDVTQRANTVIKEGQGSYGDQIQKRYRPYPFFGTKEMSLAYAVADIVVARAGAVTISEIAALGKPSIVIPLPNAASDHQRQNANEFQKYGAIVIEEGNLVTHILVDQIKGLLENPEKYANVSTSIKSFAKPQAAELIAKELLSK